MVEADEEAVETVLELVTVEEDEEELEGGVVVVIEEHKGTSQSSHAPSGSL